MESFVLPSTKFDRLDYILSNTVTDQLQFGHTWIIPQIMKFITSFPNIKFPITQQSCSLVWMTMQMLTPEQKSMLHGDDDKMDCSLTIGTKMSLHGIMLDLMHSVIRPATVTGNYECHLANQALILCDLCIQLAKDLAFTYVLIDSLEQARQNVISYRADVIREFDKMYPGKDPSFVNTLGSISF